MFHHDCAPGCPANIMVFADIAALLEQRHAQHWITVVFAWLARYEGITRCFFADDEDAPAIEVLNCISALPAGATDREIASALSGLEFLTWRIENTDSHERWDPFGMPLREFTGDRIPNCWQWEGAYPSCEAVAEWLLGQLPAR